MQARYRVKFENYQIGDSMFRIRSLFDKQQYYDPDGIAERAGITSANWPLFGVIWPSAQVLARHMSSYEVGGRRILEVGCGLALASLVLRRRGADVTVSDYHPMVSEFLAANMALNQLADIGSIDGDWTNEATGPERFDLIIGSDLLYERGHFEQLSSFIDRHAQPQAEVIIVDPGRGHAGKFSRRMQALGYSLTEERVAMELLHGEPYRGRIMTFRRRML